MQYIVRATRFEDHWYIEVPQLALLDHCDGFSQVEPTARRAIVEALGKRTAPFSVDIELQPAWTGSIRPSVSHDGV